LAIPSGNYTKVQLTLVEDMPVLKFM
jgi:hypothetical protein